jgi:hypothetical protein
MILKDYFIRFWIWGVFVFNKEKLPTVSNPDNPKMKYEIMSGAIYWEDEGLTEIRNHHLLQAFRYVLNHRMCLLAGQSNAGVIRSTTFDKVIFRMAKRHFPNWIGFDKSRCTYNTSHADRIQRIKRIAQYKMNKFFDEHDTIW